MNNLSTFSSVLVPNEDGSTSFQYDYVSWKVLPRVDFLALHRINPTRYPFLLHSAAVNPRASRYDILMAFPQETRISSDTSTDLLQWFTEAWQATRIPRRDNHPDPPPFRGGWFLYLDYELAAQIEARLRWLAAVPSSVPACAVRVPAALIRDHQDDSVIFITERGWESLADDLVRDLVTASDSEHLITTESISTPWLIEEEDPTHFLNGVNRIKEYVRAGDVFQVNLSRQWHAHAPGVFDPLRIYQQLSCSNPGPFAGFARLGETYILSSSPERLVKTTGDRVETRPIAGTHPRGREGVEDGLLREALLASAKERAEHIMLIDLERNDLGRICVPGSVQVDELMAVESYRHVHHIVSNVSGQLKANLTPVDILRAVFPGGTITGCPKIRCMEIIGELEGSSRGAYTGSMGYVNRDGDMDLNILIRTMVCHSGGVSFRAGAGIVADSVPETELAETRAKARGLIAALNGSMKNT